MTLVLDLALWAQQWLKIVARFFVHSGGVTRGVGGPALVVKTTRIFSCWHPLHEYTTYC